MYPFLRQVGGYAVGPEEFYTMSNLTKNVKITEESHRILVKACESRFGTDKIRFSDAIKVICEEEIERQKGGADE